MAPPPGWGIRTPGYEVRCEGRFDGDAVSWATRRPQGRRYAGAVGYLEALRERVVVFDGATGTNLQLRELTADDFGGAAFEGCNEILPVTRPDVVAELHASFLEVGCDVVETDTFGAFAVPLAEYGIPERTEELNLAAARIARSVADDFATPDRPRWVAGSVGPGTKFPSLGNIRFAELRDAYELQARALLSGGVDLLVIETVFDLLQAKAAMVGCRRAMAAAVSPGVDAPSGTV
ncbi:MAG: homocysteine S-methyltransferase family protein [Actinobacteria bacterium]|nr:homocysteine S-methyltransferase family protein [Actinomycetota bacterium]